METLFLEIQKAIAEGLPVLSLVDEDYGQLETDEDTYPVTFPCVLINILQVNWKTFQTGIQQGSVDIGIRLCIDCYNDTHYGSGTESRVKERMQLLGELHEAVSGIIPSGSVEPLERVTSRFITIKGGIKVYETVYNCLLDELYDEGD